MAKKNAWQKKTIAQKGGADMAKRSRMLRAVAHYVLQRGQRKTSSSLTKDKAWAKKNNARLMRQRGTIASDRKSAVAKNPRSKTWTATTRKR